MRELIQQLKEQLLLCGSVERATAAQKRSFVCASGALEEFAARLPRVWLREKELLLQLFAADAYHIRKALSECLRILILKAHRIVDLGQNEEDGEEQEDSGEALSEDDKEEEEEDRPVGILDEEDEDETGRFSERQRSDEAGDESSWMKRREVEEGRNVVSPLRKKDKNFLDKKRKKKKDREKSQQRIRSFWALQRVSLVNELLSRLEDKTPLARTWALKVLADLLGEKEALPAGAAVRTAQAASERLLDKSTMVRCAALGVFGALVHLAAKQHQASILGGRRGAAAGGGGLSEEALESHPFLLLLVNDEEDWEERRRRVMERKRRIKVRKRKEACRKNPV